MHQISGWTFFFSKIDLICAYQVPIEEPAICTPFGLFEFPRMTFGLRNVAQTFQRLVHSIFRDLPYIFPYIDDFLIPSKSQSSKNSFWTIAWCWFGYQSE